MILCQSYEFRNFYAVYKYTNFFKKLCFHFNYGTKSFYASFLTWKPSLPSFTIVSLFSITAIYELDTEQQK